MIRGVGYFSLGAIYTSFTASKLFFELQKGWVAWLFFAA